MQKIPYTLFISLVDEAVDDIYSGYEFDDYCANMSVQEVAKDKELDNDTLNHVWDIANKVVHCYDEILDEISDIIKDKYGHEKTCATFLSIKCSET